MEKYRAKMKKRLILLSGCLILYIAANCLMYAYVGIKGSEHAVDFISGFQLGAGSALLAYFIIVYISTLRSEEKLKKMYVAETDERRLMIYQKSGSAGMNFAMFGLAAAAVFAGYFDSTIFFTLLSACLFVASIRVALKLYYRNKY